KDRNNRPDDTRMLLERARCAKQLWFVPNAGHVDLDRAARGEYETRVLAFLAQMAKSQWNEQNILIWNRRTDYIGIGASSRNAKATHRRNSSAGFQFDDRRWQPGQPERLSREMGRALFLPERFHERLHDGSEEFSARSHKV